MTVVAQQQQWKRLVLLKIDDRCYLEDDCFIKHYFGVSSSEPELLQEGDSPASPVSLNESLTSKYSAPYCVVSLFQSVARQTFSPERFLSFVPSSPSCSLLAAFPLTLRSTQLLRFVSQLQA